MRHHLSNLGASLAELGAVVVDTVFVATDLEHVREYGLLGEEVKDVQSREAEAERLGGQGGATITCGEDVKVSFLRRHHFSPILVMLHIALSLTDSK